MNWSVAKLLLLCQETFNSFGSKLPRVLLFSLSSQSLQLKQKAEIKNKEGNKNPEHKENRELNPQAHAEHKRATIWSVSGLI